MGNERMKKIYICHQFMEKSHFKALYDCATIYGYEVADFIVLSQESIFGEFVRRYNEGKYGEAIKQFFRAEIKIIKLRMLRNELMIVGIAPYDKLMNRFAKVFGRNRCIYFTSWQDWSGKKCPRGSIQNKERFEYEIKSCFKGVASVSSKTAQETEKFGLPIAVVNHAIDSENYSFKKNQKRMYKYIFLGRFEKIKNIETILKYMSSHLEADIEFDFVGDGILKQEICKAEKKDNRIHYLGKWTKVDIKRRLCNYDFLVLPSWKEPFGIVLLEALASGVPCIVSDAMGPKEIISNYYNGLIFELKERNGFEKVMNYSISMKDEEYSTMCLNVEKEINKYSSKEIVKKWISLLEGVEVSR